LKDVGLGLVVGLAAGFAGARIMPRVRALGHEITPHQKALYGLGVAFGTYALAHAVHGNGL